MLVIAAFFFDGQISTLAFGSARYADLVRLTMLSACCTILAIPFMQYLQFEERARLYVAIPLHTRRPSLTSALHDRFASKACRGHVKAAALRTADIA